MKLAVKLYGQNPQGIPVEWPKEIKQDVDTMPAGYDLLFESWDALNAYRAVHQASYDRWEAAQTVAPVPQSVTPWQMRRALNQLGLRAMVEEAVAKGDQDVKDGWEFALEIKRDNPLLAAMAGSLRMEQGDLDNLFRLADSFK